MIVHLRDWQLLNTFQTKFSSCFTSPSMAAEHNKQLHGSWSQVFEMQRHRGSQRNLEIASPLQWCPSFHKLGLGRKVAPLYPFLLVGLSPAVTLFKCWFLDLIECAFIERSNALTWMPHSCSIYFQGKTNLFKPLKEMCKSYSEFNLIWVCV